MPLKPIYTKHGGWVGLKFARTGEADLAARVTLTEEMIKQVRSCALAGGVVSLTSECAAILLGGLGLYWTALGEEAGGEYPGDAEPSSPAPVEQGKK